MPNSDSRQKRIGELLAEWDSSLCSSQQQRIDALLNRRQFLLQSVAVSASVATAGLLLTACDTANNNPVTTKDTFSHQETEPWRTLFAVQQHLFPTGDNSPGAAEIRSIYYLKAVLESPAIEEEDKEFIRNGVKWLNGVSNELFSKAFYLLDEVQREKGLRSIEDSRAGERWLSLMIKYVLEALLTAPVYGGNPEGIGWKWLEYQPGFPLPTEDKKYFNLN